jgi:hypothetical protein
MHAWRVAQVERDGMAVRLRRAHCARVGEHAPRRSGPEVPTVAAHAGVVRHALESAERLQNISSSPV